MAKAISKESLIVLNFLKENEGKIFTTKQLSEELGIDKRKINGIINGSLIGLREKRCFVEKVELEGDPKKIKYIKITDKGLAALAENVELKPDALKILNFLSLYQDKNFTSDDLSINLGLDKRKINGIINGSLIGIKKDNKKDYVERVEALGEPTYIMGVRITDAGMAYNHMSALAEDREMEDKEIED